MKLYRNLGKITYQSETSAFQIFTAQPSATIFQFKSPQPTQQLLQQISTLYVLPCEFYCYSESQKGSALLLKNSKKAQTKNSDARKVCRLLNEAAKMIKRMSQFIIENIGDCSIHQFRIVNQKIVFIYIPTIRVQDKQKRQSLTLNKLKQMTKQLISSKDISQKLLIKKLQKCKTLEQLIEQLQYFESVYCIGKTKINQKRDIHQRILQRPVLLGNIKYLNKNKNKSYRKGGSLFKLDLSTSKKQSSSLHFNSISYLSQQQRQMSCTMQFSSSVTKKFNSTYFTNRRPSIKNDSRVNKNNINASRISEQSCKSRSAKNIAQSKMIDDDQLLERIRNKKKLKTQLMNHRSNDEKDLTVEEKAIASCFPKIEQQTQTFNMEDVGNKIKSMKKINKIEQLKTTKEQGTTMTDLLKQLNSNNSSTFNVQLMPVNKKEFYNKQTKIDRIVRPSIEDRVFLNQQRKNQEASKISMQLSDKKENCKIKNPLKEPPKLQKEENITESNEQIKKQQISKNQQKAIEIIKPFQKNIQKPSEKEAKESVSNCNKQNIKKTKPLPQQDFGSQLQIIDLQVKQKQNKPINNKDTTIPFKTTTTKQSRFKQNKKPEQNQFSETKKKSFYTENKFQSKSHTQKELLQNIKQEIIIKYNRLNLMGTAVANTTTYLAKYDKIFWELPMYFIYRGFYMRRLQITREAEDNPAKKLLDFEKIIQQNQKVKDLVSKLIRKITNKLKKDKNTLYRTLKPYLNLEENVSCDQVMKSYLKQYIESLSAATGKDEKLLMHLLQIIDAYLIFCGQVIDEQKRKEAIKIPSTMKKYVMGQTNLLNSYL